MSVRQISRFLFASAACILLAQAPAGRAAVIYRTAALTGMQAPGTPEGTKFGGFQIYPSINASGGVAFSAFLPTVGDVTLSNDQGIWSESSGTLGLVAREGSQAPGTPEGAVFDSFLELTQNDAGQVAFQAMLKTTGGGVTPRDANGIWSDSSGPLSLVARARTQAPGLPAGALFAEFGEPCLLNAAGQRAFHAGIQLTGASAPPDSEGIWSEGSGELTLVARKGGHAPGTPEGTDFQFFGIPVLNDAGRTAFVALLHPSGGNPSFYNGQGIWSEGSGTLTLVARDGSHAPGTSDGVTFSTFSLQSYSSNYPRPAINNVGQVAFWAALQTDAGGVTTSNDTGIWSEGSGSLALVAREGSQAPGTSDGTNFSSFGDPVLNAHGRAIFFARLQLSGDVTTANDTGIWSDRSGTLGLVAREGSHAPGTAEGANFEFFSRISMNASEKTAFLASLQTTGGGVTNSNNEGIWAEDPTGALTMIIRKGELFEVAPGDLRTVAGLSFNFNSGGEDGHRMSFNDNFALAFFATFTDGTSGIFTATLTAVPEPATFALLLIAAMFVPRRRRANSAK